MLILKFSVRSLYKVTKGDTRPSPPAYRHVTFRYALIRFWLNLVLAGRCENFNQKANKHCRPKWDVELLPSFTEIRSTPLPSFNASIPVTCTHYIIKQEGIYMVTGAWRISGNGQNTFFPKL